MRNFFKPNNSDGGQNPSRRNSAQTNLSENIATIRRTGVNTMTARKSIYTIIAAISVALIATVALVSIGNIGAQDAATTLSGIASPNCGGGTSSGEPDCSTGRIYVANKWSGLVSAAAGDNTTLSYDGPGTIGAVSLDLDHVGDNNSLYASFLDIDEAATGVARFQNIIARDSAGNTPDTLVVVVEDNDAIQRRTVNYRVAECPESRECRVPFP